jgi:hypothetical protein
MARIEGLGILGIVRTILKTYFFKLMTMLLQTMSSTQDSGRMRLAAMKS